MPTKRLPARPDLDHLKRQAKDLLNDQRAGVSSALQRIREFHPRSHELDDSSIRSGPYALSDAQWTIAREYGFASWVRLINHLASEDRARLALPHHQRINDATFRRAVDLLDDGDIDGLRDHLKTHPGLVHQRVLFEGGNYFADPTLLEFIAENPVRHDHLPPNIVEVARTILDAGARTDRRSIDSALALVCSGRVPRECGVQVSLIALLCDYGADPSGAMAPALAHGEFDAVQALIRRGATIDLAGAAALGRLEAVRDTLPTAEPALRHRALAWAAQFWTRGRRAAAARRRRGSEQVQPAGHALAFDTAAPGRLSWSRRCGPSVGRARSPRRHPGHSVQRDSPRMGGAWWAQ
jgi:hypothetical protein